jgi:predicted  nucleic acid-binding Zn-ribbon protein
MARKKKQEEIEEPIVIQHPKTEEELKNEQRLIALYTLQLIDSQVDKIKIVRGELPLEVEDLEDEIAGLQTRIDKFVQETQELKKLIADKNGVIQDSQSLIKKYEEQQMNVRNNREYDSLSKELEFQTLEIQLAEKRIREYTVELESKKTSIEEANIRLVERSADLEVKKSELNDIVKETQMEEDELIAKSKRIEEKIDGRLLSAYKRIRNNARNGLSVVPIERDACGGCFNKIPPQHQLEIKMHKKIIVCEYCGRILIDAELAESMA